MTRAHCGTSIVPLLTLSTVDFSISWHILGDGRFSIWRFLHFLSKMIPFFTTWQTKDFDWINWQYKNIYTKAMNNPHHAPILVANYYSSVCALQVKFIYWVKKIFSHWSSIVIVQIKPRKTYYPQFCDKYIPTDLRTSLADPRGPQGRAPPRVQFLLFSCSFQEK